MDNPDQAVRIARLVVDAIPAGHPNKVVLLHELGIQIGDLYSKTGAIALLDEATRIAREAVDAAPDDFPDRSGLLYNLGIRLSDRYLKLRDFVDLQEAIEVTRRAVNATPSTHPYRARRLNSLAMLLGDRYSKNEAMADLEEAIQLTRQAIDLASNETRPLYLNNLGVRLSDRYQKTKKAADIEEAVRLIRLAIAAAPVHHPERARWLSSLGTRLAIRFSRAEEIADLDEAIEVTREAININPSDQETAERLNKLGNHLITRYWKKKEMGDFKEAIQVARQALSMMPPDHSDRTTALLSLAMWLNDQFSETGELSDLKEAIQTTRDAIDEIEHNHPNRASLLQNLGALLGDQFTTTRAVTDLDEAIKYTALAIESTPEGHSDLAMRLNNLGVQFGARFSETGEIGDLEKAIQAAKDSLAATPIDNPDRPRRLNNLGNRLGHHFSRIGAISHLDEAVQLAREAVKLTPEGHPDMVGRLNNLGGHLCKRYWRTQAIADLEEAIFMAKRAERATPDGHANKAVVLNSLAILLGDRYARTKAMADLEGAIQAERQALHCSPDGRPNRATYLNNLANKLGNRFYRTLAIPDLEEAIKLLREAIDITPKAHPDSAMYLNSLGIRLGDRHLVKQIASDLDEAIEFARLAVSTTPEEHPDLAARLTVLGDLLITRHSGTKAICEAEEAVTCYQSALHQESAPVANRIQAGAAVLRNSPDWQQAHEASSLAVRLIPRLTARSFRNADRQHVLSQVVGLASNAAAAALRAGKGPIVALELVEKGRGVLAASLDQLRTDLHELRREHSGLADRFNHLRDELERPAPVIPPFPDKTDTAKEWDELILEIRKIRGFEHFLLPPSTSEMQAAARHGPVVVINVSEYRCDALLVEQHQVRALPLANLSSKDIREKAGSSTLGNLRVLEWLWDTVACPVLEALGFTGPPPDGKWPHVWWVPTGLLTRFPLHAAGRHRKRSFETVLDRVMSSYSPTLKAIIQGRRYRIPSSTSARALLVAMEDTPGNSVRLPFATKEVTMLSDLLRSNALDPIEPGRCKQDIVPHLPGCRIFHFAGHGHADDFDPSNSHLCLEDEDDPLRVADLLDMNLREQPSFLAYLSACGTGRIKGEKFVDESIHLISAFQLAGFSHVIGTLWNVNDYFCVEMAEIAYKEIVGGAMTDESVCWGLHKASRELRDRWLGGLAKARRGDELAAEHQEGIQGVNHIDGQQRDDRLPVLRSVPTESPPWVPYVHYGI